MTPLVLSNSLRFTLINYQKFKVKKKLNADRIIHFLSYLLIWGLDVFLLRSEQGGYHISVLLMVKLKFGKAFKFSAIVCAICYLILNYVSTGGLSIICDGLADFLDGLGPGPVEGRTGWRNVLGCWILPGLVMIAAVGICFASGLGFGILPCASHYLTYQL